MRFEGRITKHGNGHKVLLPSRQMKDEGLKDNDDVVVNIVKKEKETSCAKCTHSKDCWVRGVMTGSKVFTFADLALAEQRIVMRASNGECDLYEEESQ